MGEQAVPDEEIPGLAGYGFDLQSFEVGKSWIAIRGLGFDPLVECIVKSRNALKSALIFRCVRQIKNPLDLKGDRILAGVDVPMNHTGMTPIRLIFTGGRLHVGSIQRDPKLVTAKNLAKRLIHLGILATIPAAPIGEQRFSLV